MHRVLSSRGTAGRFSANALFCFFFFFFFRVKALLSAAGLLLYDSITAAMVESGA